MNTRVDTVTTFPRPAKAANEDFVPAVPGKAASGWDAYEVWRTRIKPQQQASNRGTPRNNA